jgi:predicted O-methyltransferase YrrM
MLEIGGFYGNSLKMWREYLHPGSRITAIDLDSKLVKTSDSGGVHVRIGLGQDAISLAEVAAEFGPFDVIIDAGSKNSAEAVNSFCCLFENALSDPGVYVVEDVYCDYWTLYNSFSFSDLVTALIDAVHGHYRIARRVDNFRAGHMLVVRRAARLGCDAAPAGSRWS